jgi:hypothetical protein
MGHTVSTMGGAGAFIKHQYCDDAARKSRDDDSGRD